MITFPRLRRSHGLHAADTLPAAPAQPAVPEVAHEEPHGIARPEVLAALVALSQAETQAGDNTALQVLTQAWAKPDDLYRDEHDTPPAMVRGYAPQPDAPARWQAPVSPEESALRVRRITYPPPGSGGVQYSAVMCQVSAATGTTSRWERPGAWPRHGIEAGTERAA